MKKFKIHNIRKENKMHWYEKLIKCCLIQKNAVESNDQILLHFKIFINLLLNYAVTADKLFATSATFTKPSAIICSA